MNFILYSTAMQLDRNDAGSTLWKLSKRRQKRRGRGRDSRQSTLNWLSKCDGERAVFIQIYQFMSSFHTYAPAARECRAAVLDCVGPAAQAIQSTNKDNELQKQRCILLIAVQQAQQEPLTTVYNIYIITHYLKAIIFWFGPSGRNNKTPAPTTPPQTTRCQSRCPWCFRSPILLQW